MSEEASEIPTSERLEIELKQITVGLFKVYSKMLELAATDATGKSANIMFEYFLKQLITFCYQLFNPEAMDSVREMIIKNLNHSLTAEEAIKIQNEIEKMKLIMLACNKANVDMSELKKSLEKND